MFILGTHIFIEVVGSTHRLLNMVHIFGSLTHAGVVALSIEVTKLELMLFNLFSCVEKLVAYDYMVVCAESRFESAEENVVLLELVNERWVTEVFIPTNLRAHPNRGSFLFALSTDQHDQVFKDGHPMPPDSAEIPPTWRKAVSRTDGNGS